MFKEAAAWFRRTTLSGTIEQTTGVVFAMLRSRTVALDGCDRVVVTDDEAEAAVFTRNDAGEVFKDGKPFRNTKEP